MAPIPVHIEDPISPTIARKAEQEPQTQPATTTINSSPAYAPAATTAATTFSQAYSPARPGAAAVPAPTTPASRPIPPPTRTQPLTEQSGLPPPPQPGPAPSLANATAFNTNATQIPPPPMAGTSGVIVPPPQAQYSPPGVNMAPTHSTESNAGYRRAGPTTLNMGPIITPSTQHPPGYVQNAYAQELNPAQRASLEVQQQRERQENGTFGGGLLGNQQSSDGRELGIGETAGEAWDAVKTWSEGAGKRVSQIYGEAHDAAWNLLKKAS